MLTTNIQQMWFQAVHKQWELNVLMELRSLEPEQASDVRYNASRAFWQQLDRSLIALGTKRN